MRHISNLVGNRYGNLVVLEFKGRDSSKGSTYWRCLCDCGKEKILTTNHLKSAGTVSCGCQGKLNKGEAMTNIVYGGYKRNAKAKNLKFSLTLDEFKYLTNQNCYYCGIIPSTKRSNRRYNGDFIYNGIDRVDNTKGYMLNNCVPCCWTCNKMKSSLSADEFNEWTDRLVAHRTRHL